jgi:hypothetical protein
VCECFTSTLRFRRLGRALPCLQLRATGKSASSSCAREEGEDSEEEEAEESEEEESEGEEVAAAVAMLELE